VFVISHARQLAVSAALVHRISRSAKLAIPLSLPVLFTTIMLVASLAKTLSGGDEARHTNTHRASWPSLPHSPLFYRGKWSNCKLGPLLWAGTSQPYPKLSPHTYGYIPRLNLYGWIDRPDRPPDSGCWSLIRKGLQDPHVS
jgi:hypothetical protein